MAFSRIIYGPVVLLMALAPAASNSDPQSKPLFAFVGQLLYGFAGIEGPQEMGYRQSITPSHLQEVA